MTPERASAGGSVTLPLHGRRQVDVLVAGGGVAGVYAALGAADHVAAGHAAAGQGAAVLLVERHGFVGGQATAGGVHTFCGETRFVNDRWREMVRRLGVFGGIARYRPNADGRAFDCESLKFVLQEMLAEAGVGLLLHTQVLSVERDGDRVAAVVLANKSGLTRVEPAFAVDATGDADLVARGGWPYRKGGPVLMPGDPPTVDASAGRLQLPMSLYFTLVDSGAAVAPVLPPGCPEYRDDREVPMITVIPHGHHVTVKMKVIGHDATDGASLSAAEQAGRRQMMGVVHYLQTRGYRGARYPNHRLAWVAPHVGIREGRRVEAVYRLSADDILAGRRFPDAVAVGSYHTDYHWPTVAQRAGTGVTVQCPPHHVPLRSMRPRGAANLLVPGRSLGGDHLATSSFRVMGTCAQTGFAAGVAAAMGAPERSVEAVAVPELRARLRRAGVRFDLAPYYGYLRRRRGYDERAGAAPGPVTGLAVTELATGEVLIACAAGGTLTVLRRCQERWQPAVTVASGLDGAAGAEVAFAVQDGGRNRTEGLEEAPVMADEVAECDAPPQVALRAGAGGWASADGGVSWRAPCAGANPASGPAPSSSAPAATGLTPAARPGSPPSRPAAGPGGNGACQDGRPVPAPPVAGAPVVALTLTPDDRATLGAARRYAAAWTDGGGVVLGAAGERGDWRQTAAAVPGGGGPCALTATADGVLLACVDGDAIRCVRAPLDAVLGAGARAGARAGAGAGADARAADAAWHHDDAGLIDALKEPQPAAVR